MRYSRLTQFNPENVSRLKIAWVFHTGDVSDGKHEKQRSGFEVTPILVDGLLIFATGFNRVIAVNPETGTLRWAYDPKIDPTWDYGDALVNRGVAMWFDTAHGAQTGAPCRRRIYEASLDARLIALDAATGVPCADFGDKGEVSLRDVPRYRPGQYHMTSPPAVIDDLICQAEWSGLSMRVQGLCAGVGIQSTRTSKPPQAAAAQQRSGRLAPATRGPSWLWTMNVIWSSFLQEAPAQTITVDYAPATTNGLIR
jgi:glucose dehydrogenase